MKFQGAVITEQGVTFAIVIVKLQVVQSNQESGRALGWAQRCFPGIPVVLAAQDQAGRWEYRGRDDLAKFLASIQDPYHQIPWKEYTVG